VIILNANPNADALHPDAIYRLNIDNDGDYLTDIAFSYVFSKPENGRQIVDVLVATGSESRLDGAPGTKIIANAEVSFGSKPNIIKSGHYTFFAGSRSDAFFFDFDGSRACSIPEANGTSPSLISAASLHGAPRGRGDWIPQLGETVLGSSVTLVTDARPLVWHQFRSQLASFAGPRRKLPWRKSQMNSSD
jgi:hypothetical protein